MIYENSLIYIEIHDSEIPWLKIFTKRKIKEFSQCTKEEREEIFKLLVLIEKEMIEYYHPEKINIAQFGNYLPHLHWHIMARFKEDSCFPEPMWGEKQREGSLKLPPFKTFINNLLAKIG